MLPVNAETDATERGTTIENAWKKGSISFLKRNEDILYRIVRTKYRHKDELYIGTASASKIKKPCAVQVVEFPMAPYFSESRGNGRVVMI